MKTIQINTTQNVSIEYKTATLIERIGAYLIDQIMIWASIGILYLFVSIGVNSPSLAFYLVMVPIFGFYSLAWEILNNGQSPGKKAIGLRVVKFTGEKIGLYDYIMRWAFRLVDIYATLGTIASLTIASSPRSQRIGDYLADTTVINVRAAGRLSLENIMQLGKLENHVITHPEVVQFTEEEMLLIKEVAFRYQKYRNEHHLKAVNQLLQRIEDHAGIKATGDPLAFLNSLIKDYVALTR
ncbi:MAG: RDD family protein [Bacteroidales bacterium]|jgi:uncharacterized RDD family membrane protein YckC